MLPTSRPARRSLAASSLAAIALAAPALAQAPDPSGPLRMKAIVHREYGPPDLLRLEEIERPTLADDRVLVRVRAAALNPLDIYRARGAPYVARLDGGLVRPKSVRLGVDMAGVVEAVGRNVTRFKPGDEVFGLRLGAFGEYVDARETLLALKPANVTFEQAAAAPVAGVTALQGLRDKGKVGPGQKVLVNGASGGVGTFAVQIAKALGAEVTGVCSTRNVELVRSLGADHVVDYAKEDFTRSGERYDVILDLVATQSLADYRRALKPRGIYVLVGFVDKGLWLKSVRGFAEVALLSPFVSQELTGFITDVTSQDLDVLRELMLAGKVTPVIDRRYRLGEVPEALRYLETGRARGKVVITMDLAGETAPGPSGAAPGVASGLGTYLFLFAVAAALVGLPFFLALPLNRRFQRRNPGKRPYRWGYFVSVASLVAGVALGVALEAGPAVLVACVLVYGVLAWGFARRRRWAWIALTIVTFNPITWIVNLVYLRKRWREDAAPARAL